MKFAGVVLLIAFGSPVIGAAQGAVDTEKIANIMSQLQNYLERLS